jgi:hypothetical protein
MAEYDLACNLDKGYEYTGFKELYQANMVPPKFISENGHVYDITNTGDSEHIIKFLNLLEEEEQSPQITMTSGSFFSMNIPLRNLVVKHLIKLSEKGDVTLYIGENFNSISKSFKGSAVRIKCFNRKKDFIPHFIKSKKRFNVVTPHTEKKIVRVDIDSKNLDPQNVERILAYFDKLAAGLKVVKEF